MLNLAYLLVIIVGAYLVFYVLDLRFHMLHRLRRSRSRAAWRERNRREGRRG